MSKIEWTNKTWNPIIGCSKISAGCKNCYAEKFALSLACNEKTCYKYGPVISDGKWNGTTNFIKSELEKPFHWKEPQMIFVCSMGDLFHESVPFNWIVQVLYVMSYCHRHIFQILTKRPDRMKDFFDNWGATVYDNVWPGITVEHPDYLWRIEKLLQIPAKVRFVSCEPLLNSIFFGDYLYPGQWDRDITSKLNWVIAGPETGPGKRECKKEWIESLYEQCKAAGVPFFDKKNILGMNIKQYPNAYQNTKEKNERLEDAGKFNLCRPAL